MLTDPILDAWMIAVDGAVATWPELRPWFGDREGLIAASESLDGYTYDPADVVLLAGASERHAVVLAHGAVEVVQAKPDGSDATVRLARAPVTLGAMGFAIGLPRAHTVRALSSGIGLHLSRPALATIGERSPEVAIGLLRWLALDLASWLRETRGRLDPWSRTHGMIGPDRTFPMMPPGRVDLQPGEPGHADALTRLSAIRCLQGHSARRLLPGLGHQVRLVRVAAGAAVVSDGDDDRSLLILLDGRASVRNTAGDVLARFDAGSEFASAALIGEIAFLCGGRRDGTVVAETDAILLELPDHAAPWVARADPDLAFRIHVAVLRAIGWRLREQDVDRERTAAILSGDFEAWLHG